jgi:excinuclease UvrABC helicase subunit UvrB
MYAHARELEFEQAARIRDKIEQIRAQSFELPESLPQ